MKTVNLVRGIFQLTPLWLYEEFYTVPTGKKHWAVSVLTDYESKLEEELAIEGLDPFIKECLLLVNSEGGAEAFKDVVTLSDNPSYKEVCEVMLRKYSARGVPRDDFDVIEL